MSKSQFEKQLNSLKNSVKPDQDWVESNRDILLSQISSQYNENRSWFFDTAVSAYKVMRPVGLTLVITAMVFSGGVFGAWASEDSLPGEVLYPVKLGSEKFQLSLTGSLDKRAQLHIEFAGKRLEEINKVQEQEKDNGRKKEKIKQAITHYKTEVQSAKDTLNTVEKEESETKKVVQVAKLVDEKVAEYKEVLKNKVKTDTDIKQKENEDVKENLKEAIKLTSETEKEAVLVMVKQTSKEDLAVEDKEDIEKTVKNKIDKIVKEVEDIEKNLSEAENTSAGDVLNEDSTLEEATLPVNEDEATESVDEELFVEGESDDSVSVETVEELNISGDGNDNQKITDENPEGEAIESEQLDEDSDNEGNQGIQEAGEKLVQPMTEDKKQAVKESSQKAKTLLEQANSDVENGDIESAVQKFVESSDIVVETQLALDDAEQAGEVEQEVSETIKEEPVNTQDEEGLDNTENPESSSDENQSSEESTETQDEEISNDSDLNLEVKEERGN